MRNVVVSIAALAAVAGCAGCKAPSSPNDASAQATSVNTVPVSRGLHLRAVFDRAPGNYVGRFVPKDLAASELDENRAMKTVCSAHFQFHEVAANQQMDELAWVSTSASGALGFTSGTIGAGGSLAQNRGKLVRVHYTITNKLQLDTDATALAACCERNAGACTDTVVGEFIKGTGEIYETTSSATEVAVNGGVPILAARAAVSDASQWKKLQTFEDTYFAFVPVATGIVPAEAPKGPCDFCTKLPEDPNGLYFCGVSSPSLDESAGRDLAMQNARVQVIKYLGEQIQTRTETISSSARGIATSESFTTALAKGIATRVKDQRYCSEKEHSPEHRTTFKVLAYVAHDAIDSAASQALADVAAKPDDAVAVRNALKNARSK